MFWLRSILLVGILSYAVTGYNSVTVPNKANQKSSPESLPPSKEQMGKVSEPNHQKKTTLDSPETKMLLEQTVQLNDQMIKLIQQNHPEKAIPIAEQEEQCCSKLDEDIHEVSSKRNMEDASASESDSYTGVWEREK